MWECKSRTGGSAYRKDIPMLTFVHAYLQSRFGNERGSVAAEYGLLIFLIALAIIVAVGALGGRLSALFTDVTNGLTTRP